MQEFKLDLTARGIAPRLLAKQGDVGRKFRAVITDNGEAYDIPADALLSVWYSGTSGEGNYSMIGENSAFSIDDNAVTVELITQMLTNHGSGNVCLVMNRQDGTQIGTWNIPYIVEQLPGMGSSASEQYFTALSEVAGKAAESAAKAAEAAATFETDTSLSVAGKAADAAATGEALVALGAPHNYLDNSDFRNPVNQRGEASYQLDSGYTIDRWKMQWSGDGTLTINDGYITLYRATHQAYLIQNIPTEARLFGKTVTLAAKVRGKGHIGRIFESADVRDAVYFTSSEWMIALYTFVVPTYSFDTHVFNGIEIRNSGDESVDVEWIALYEGEYTEETLPEYKPKGYGVELAECQRYFLQYNFSDVILPAKMYSGGGSADVSFFLPCTMRLTKPTVSVTASHCQLFADNSNTDCNITEAYLSTGNFVGLTAVAESNLTGSAVAVCRIMGKLTLSADL